MKIFFRLILVASSPLAACNRAGSDSPATASSSSAAASHASTAPTSTLTNAGDGTQASSACPRTGLWALCSVEKRLQDAGFVLRRVDGPPPLRAGFSVSPAAYTLAHSRLEVFIYPSEAALASDMAKIDTVVVAPRGARRPWPILPTFVRSANMAAVFLTENATQAERLTLALSAGAPQR